MGPKTIDRTRERELGGAQAGDEPAPAGSARLLERSQHRVHGRESAGNAFGAHSLACDHTVAFEQLQCRCMRGLGRRRCGFQQRRDQRPAACARGRAEPSQTARVRTPARRRRSRTDAPRHPQRAERVVRDFAGPHQVPQPGEHDLFVRSAGCAHEVGPERRAGRAEAGANRIVDVTLRTFGRRR